MAGSPGPADRRAERPGDGHRCPGYMTESPGFSAFMRTTAPSTTRTRRRGGDWSSSWATPILDHAPKGRDEGEAWQLWIRRHDEYDS